MLLTEQEMGKISIMHPCTPKPKSPILFFKTEKIKKDVKKQINKIDKINNKETDFDKMMELFDNGAKTLIDKIEEEPIV